MEHFIKSTVRGESGAHNVYNNAMNESPEESCRHLRLDVGGPHPQLATASYHPVHNRVTGNNISLKG